MADSDPASEAPPQGYNAELMGDTLTQEQYDQMPDWRKERFADMASKRWAASKELERERGRNSRMETELRDLKQMVMSGNGNGNGHKAAEPPKEGIEGIATPKLREFVTLAEQTLVAVSQDPTNEELVKQARSIRPELLAEAREQLARRAALGVVEEREKTWEAQGAAKAKIDALGQRMASDFGADVFNPKSDLMQAAAEELEAMSDMGTLIGREATMYLAVKNAHARLNGSNRRLSPTDMQRLQIEGGTRREANPLNQIAALEQRGDWKSKVQVTDLKIDQQLAAMRAAMNG